jgi:hypothetical protein
MKGFRHRKQLRVSERPLRVVLVQEQLAREKAVSGRIQLQVFYHDEKQELVVSVLAADDLAPREDTGYGSLPEAYVKLRLMPVT